MAEGTKGSASFLNHLSKKETLPFQYLDDEWRARKLQRSRINQRWRSDPRLASRRHHSPLATKNPAPCVDN